MEQNGTSTLPDTLGTVPTALTGLGKEKSVTGRANVARQQLPALFKGRAQAEAEAEFGKFERDQDVAKKTAQAERTLADKSREETQALEAGIKPYKEFEVPEYKASDYAANTAIRIVTALALGGVAKSSAMGQLQAIRSMQEAEDRGLRDSFTAARMKFDEAEKSRIDNNKMLKDRFDRMMNLLSRDRNAALAEAKIIEAKMGQGIIAAQLRAGNYSKAYDLFNKAIEAGDKIALEQMKQAAKPAKVQQLPSDLVKSFENVGQTNVALNRAAQTAKPEFFGVAPSDAIADLIVSGVEKDLPVGDIMKGLGVNAPRVTRETVEWWKDYQAFVAQTRNKLFGATLTPREAGDFRKFTIGPATDPKVAADYFNRQLQIIAQAVERERAKGRTRGVDDAVIGSYLDLPKDQVTPGGSNAPAAGGGQRQAFATEAEADAAFAAGKIGDGSKITIGGRNATYRAGQ
jgi:hypothetical protein